MSRDLHARYGGWALVTGASSGIGASFAELLAARGFPLVLTARRADRLAEMANRLGKAHGIETHVVPLDLSTPDAPAQLVAAVGDREIGLLINNAGFGYSGLFSKGDPARDAKMVQLNCGAVVALTHAYLPAMLERNRGGIVIVASTAGFQPTPYFAVYGATKAFDLNFAESLWSELRGTSVDVVALCPGETKTEFAVDAHFGRDPGGMAPGPVAEAALHKLGRAPSVVTGLLNKIAVFQHRIFPRGFVANSTGEVLARSLLGKSSKAVREENRD